MFLVTGGCGFIGSHLVEELVHKGYRVRVLDDLSSGTLANLPSHVEFCRGSITNEKILAKALEGVKGVFHLAARVSVVESIERWHQNHLINCGGTVNLFALAKKIPIIFASSAAVYGDVQPLPHKEDMQVRPLSPYAVDKLASEMHAQVAWHIDRTPSISCRFFNVYGPRQKSDSPYAGVITKFTSQILHNKPLKIYGDGNQSRDFIYVKDVATMLCCLMEKPFKGAHVYNLCTGKAHTINDLVNILERTLSVTTIKEYFPTREGEVLHSRGDPHKLLKDKKLESNVSLAIGINLMLNEVKNDSTHSPILHQPLFRSTTT